MGEGHWSSLQMEVLGDMLSMAVKGGDVLGAWSAAARLLRGYYPLITPPAQVRGREGERGSEGERGGDRLGKE